MSDWREEKQFHRGVNVVFGILYALVIAKGLEEMGKNIPIISSQSNYSELYASLSFTIFMIVLALEITRAHESDSYYTEGRGKIGVFVIYLFWILQYSLHYAFIESVGEMPVEINLPRYMAFVLIVFCAYIAIDLLIIQKHPLKEVAGYPRKPIYALIFYASSLAVFLTNDILVSFGLEPNIEIWILILPWIFVYVVFWSKASFGE